MHQPTRILFGAVAVERSDIYELRLMPRVTNVTATLTTSNIISPVAGFTPVPRLDLMFSLGDGVRAFCLCKALGDTRGYWPWIMEIREHYCSGIGVLGRFGSLLGVHQWNVKGLAI
jgi:hypothetical protein